MESSIECVSSTDGMDEDEISHPNPFSQFSSSKPSHNNINNNNNLNGVVINPATSVHELLECPELGDIRCLALEKVAESLELPCKYCSLGCPEIFPYYSKLKHEAACNFRPYNCPYAGSECSVVGDIPYLVAHLRDDHKVDMHSGCTFNHRYVKSNPRDVENATWMLTLSNLEWLPFIWLFFDSWETRWTLGTIAIVWRLEEMVENLYGKAPHGALEIVTEKFETAMTALLYSAIWHFFSLEETGKSLSFA
ncbi:hypothetical protein DH2020_006193 [Rehmannia glutinosa]|uniref:SIAH-type domain-containing protein n=1 Tax=Rehmannia glutinosa TaxID=99300 RepID=A0ABR0XI75_REHGL